MVNGGLGRVVRDGGSCSSNLWSAAALHAQHGSRSGGSSWPPCRPTELELSAPAAPAPTFSKNTSLSEMTMPCAGEAGKAHYLVM